MNCLAWDPKRSEALQTIESYRLCRVGRAKLSFSSLSDHLELTELFELTEPPELREMAERRRAGRVGLGARS